MKVFLSLVILLPLLLGCATNEPNEKSNKTDETRNKATKKEVENTSALTEQSIKEIQQSKRTYLLCINDEMQKHLQSDARNMDSRHASDKVLKICEPTLAKIRTVFVAQNAPEAVANQYLKRTRTQTARKVLQEMMYASATNQQKIDNNNNH